MAFVRDEAELAEVIASASAPFAIKAGGTRGQLGGLVEAETLDVSAISGISLYEPGALTLVAKAGTPLAEIEEVLRGEGQRLSFEPMDHRKLLGLAGEPTIGGMCATNASGPRRVQAGACRDSMLGVRYVDGKGCVIKNGGRVMKNVTGYDLVKLQGGAFGTLGVLTEIAFKLGAIPEATATVQLAVANDKEAIAAMSSALTSPFDVTGAAYHAGQGVFLRLEGMAGAVAYRATALQDRLSKAGFGEIAIHEGNAGLTWEDIRDVSPLAEAGNGDAPIWRLHVQPSLAAGVIEKLRRETEVEALFDWGGGLVWLALPQMAREEQAGAAHLSQAMENVKCHARLVRGSKVQSAMAPSLPTRAPLVAKIEAGLREKFDPKGLFNPGRLMAMAA